RFRRVCVPVPVERAAQGACDCLCVSVGADAGVDADGVALGPRHHPAQPRRAGAARQLCRRRRRAGPRAHVRAARARARVGQQQQRRRVGAHGACALGRRRVAARVAQPAAAAAVLRQAAAAVGAGGAAGRQRRAAERVRSAGVVLYVSAVDKGGVDQRRRRAAQVLRHVSHLPAAARVALPLLRQLRRARGPPLHLAQQLHWPPQLPLLLLVSAVHHAAGPVHHGLFAGAPDPAAAPPRRLAVRRVVWRQHPPPPRGAGAVPVRAAQHHHGRRPVCLPHAADQPQHDHARGAGRPPQRPPLRHALCPHAHAVCHAQPVLARLVPGQLGRGPVQPLAAHQCRLGRARRPRGHRGDDSAPPACRVL
ncbi:hypothetical protein H4S01_001540, partial [Coemansia sp. RSA 2610]